MVRLVSRGGDPNRRRSLEFNELARKQRRTWSTPDESGHVAFQMHELDYWYWTTQERWRELAASDPEIARKAWIRFLNSPEGSKYKLNPTEGKRSPVHRIIVR